MSVLGIIPARLGSTRLRQKMLADLGGKPLVVRTYENARLAKKLDRVIVACDDQAILEAVTRSGGEALLTSRDCENGTARCREIAGKVPASVYLNLQGDEPFMVPQAIDALVSAFVRDREAGVGTLAVPSRSEEAYLNPSVVKVVRDLAGRALYFSRAPIPARREGGIPLFYKHLGIYAYRPVFFQNYAALVHSPLEDDEQLEQLRFLANGIRILVVETQHDSLAIDTEADLECARQYVRKRECQNISL